jgi:hypothetical protein
VQSKLTVGASTVSPYNFNVWGGAFESYISLNNTNSGTGSADGFQIGLEPNGTDVYFLNRENGFIQFRTADTNRVRIANTGNLLINTTTDAGFRLDVNGTARFIGNTQTFGTNRTQGSVLVGPSIIGNAGVLGIDSSGTGSASRIFMHNSAGSVTTLIDAGGTSYFNAGNVGIGTTDASTPFGTAKGLVINAGAGNDAQIRLQNTSTGNTPNDGGLLSISNVTMYLWNYEPAPLIFGVGNVERMRIFSTGNLGINTTADAGFRLDVNGNTRSNRFYANDGITLGRISFEGFNNNTGIDYNSTTGLFRLFAASGLTFLSAGFNLDTIISPVRNTVDNLGDVVIQGGGSERARFKAIGNIGFGTNAPNASSLLDLTSTTRGFLPPRMTNAQRTAIVSPAVGLIVYCTDVTEGLWVYKSTGWTFIV